MSVFFLQIVVAWSSTGSILGQFLFSLYVSPVGFIYDTHNAKFTNHHCYANDTQDYQSFSPLASNGLEECLGQLSRCVDEIIEWMSVPFKDQYRQVKFNMFGAPSYISSYGEISVRVGNDIIVTRSVRNLGFHMNSTMNN